MSGGNCFCLVGVVSVGISCLWGFRLGERWSRSNFVSCAQLIESRFVMYVFCLTFSLCCVVVQEAGVIDPHDDHHDHHHHDASNKTAHDLGVSGGLFNPKQLDFLLKYCEYETPLADEVSLESFDELAKLHEQFMSTLAEQFLFHEDWDVTASGPLKRRDHDLQA